MSIDFSNELFQIPNYKYVGNNYPGTTIKFDTYKYHNVDGSSFFNLIYEEVADSKSANISLHLNSNLIFYNLNAKKTNKLKIIYSFS